MKTSQDADNKTVKLTLFMRRKLAFIYILVAAVLFALAVYIVVMISKKGEEYQKIILSQQGYSTTSVPFRRGSIMDRNYTTLAYSEEVYNLILDPSVILYTGNKNNPSPNRAATVQALSECFGYPESELQELLDTQPDSQYIRYARQLSEESVNRFLAYQNSYNSEHNDRVTGVWFEKEYKRLYPYKDLACTVLGFSGADASEGHWGLEEYYNESLTGTNGKTYGYMNADGVYEQVAIAPTGGYTLVSTVDFTIQSIVEQKVNEFCENNRYTNVGVIVMNPQTGEILAMDTDKRFDLNNPMDFTLMVPEEELEAMTDEEKSELQNQIWRNYTISDAYSPGSVSKELTVAMALEENAVNPETIFYCDGGETINGVHIGCIAEHGTINLEQALWVSCNDALMNMSTRLSVSQFLRYQREYGLGQRTGLDLPGEAAGLLFSETNMSAVDMATSSFGQGYSCTMIQMAAAYCALINGGNYFQPHIVRQILDENGGVIKTIEPQLVRQIVTEETSAFLRLAAYDTVEYGTSPQQAKIAGYKIGGKTGTAQKYPIEEHEYVISFMGFSPVDTPQLLVYAVVDEPEHEGTEVSSFPAIWLERDIMAEILPYLGIPKED
ncbi:MAG: penicillin-binding protein 2 [Lachnospiraceae bacterium]|nr:penicillin-binding protein 2 [Lachnospiraceae bacterium]